MGFEDWSDFSGKYDLDYMGKEAQTEEEFVGILEAKYYSMKKSAS